MRILFPELTWISGEAIPGCAVHLKDNGIIDSITRGAFPEDDADSEHLPGQLLIPGMVNGHSHAFQRAIRGRTHSRPPGCSDFWSWRETMYEVVEGITPEALYAISFHAFKEMLEAGYTHVGEFHYVHHQQDGTPYEDRNELANTVIQAAIDAGILITLLRVVYLETGFDSAPPSPGQRRFMDESVAIALHSVEELLVRWEDHAGVTVGIAPHSVRAVHRKALTEIATWASTHGVPVHVHASEQEAEVEQTLRATGMRPVELLHSAGLLGSNTTLVHGTHLSHQEEALIADSETMVCVCPSTEADLGDGLIALTPLLHRGVALTLGSDSQAIIDPFHEMRSLDMHERLRTLTRAPSTPEGGVPGSPLLTMSTSHGWRSLGWESSDIKEGNPANLCALDLNHPALLGLDKDCLMAGVTLHGDRTMVKQSWVQGRKIVTSGRHVQSASSEASFRNTMATLFPG